MSVLKRFGRPKEWERIQALDPVSLELVDTPLHRVPGCNDWLVVGDEQGGWRCIPARCPHRGLPFEGYGRDGPFPGQLRCVGHGCIFDLSSGACLNCAGSRDAVSPLRITPMFELPDGTWAVEIGHDAIFTGQEARIGG